MEINTLKSLIIKTLDKLGPKCPEAFYQRLLAGYLTKEGFTIEVEKEYKIIIDDIDVGSRRCDIYIEELDMILEIKHGQTNTDTAKQQTRMYMDLQKAKFGLLVIFPKKNGYPQPTDIKENLESLLEIHIC